MPKEIVDVSIPGNIQGLVTQWSGQPDLGKDMPAHCMEGWTR